MTHPAIALRRGWLALPLLLALLVAASPARADVRILSFSAAPTSAEAGGHPDFGVHFLVSSHQTVNGPCDCADAKDTTVHLPAGLIGDPHATPQCDAAHFAAERCPPDSQVGVAEVSVADKDREPGQGSRFITPLYNLVPPPTEPGLLGFMAALTGSPTFETISARTGTDYGLDVAVTSIEHFLPVSEFTQVTWGVPAAHVHDNLRFALGQEPILIPAIFGVEISHLCNASGQLSDLTEPASIYQFCANLGQGPPLEFVGAIGETQGGPGYPIESGSPETPFLQSPTTCGLTTLASGLDVLAYDGGETHAAYPWPETTGCAQLSFAQSLFAQPTTAETDSPSGIDVDLKVPMFESPETPSPSEIKGTVVTLPPGFTINAAAADGKSACADEEAKFGTTAEAKCPELAKLGTLEVHSPVLPGVLPGAIYIGKPLPGERYRLFLTFDGFGVHVKLAGSVHPDPNTGQLVTEFRNLPQFPFEDFNLHFFGAEHGILATPTQCGTYPVRTEFEPWDGAIENKISTQYFTLSSGPRGTPCPNGPRPFSPSLGIANASNTAGAHTAFSLELSRADGEQNLSALDVTTPPGFSATLKGIPYCPEAAIAAAEAPGQSGIGEQEHPSCPAASLVGEAFAGAGVGTHPFYAPGKVYLAGPYKGAPLSLVVITPAVSGPYDLGDVVVRAALHVDPETAQVTAVTEGLPKIVAGVPLRLRRILIRLNRPGFALNPTDCEGLRVEAEATGSEGATATPSSPFPVANCARLRFAPKLSLSLSGSVKRTGHPAIKAVLTMSPGEANIAKAQVTLPHAEFLDQGHIQNVCTRAQFAAAGCPPSSVLGYARAITPLLDRPLEGPVYLMSGFGHKLPDVAADLNGQIMVLLHGKVDTGPGGGIRNTFEVVPDAPVSKFVLSLKGGNRGLIQNSESLCVRPLHAIAKFDAHNGKFHDLTPPLKVKCGVSHYKSHK